MNTKMVKIGEKEFKIKELSFDDSLELGNLKDNDLILKKLLELACDPAITDEVRKTLTIKEGFELIKEINILNGLDENFLSSLKTE